MARIGTKSSLLKQKRWEHAGERIVVNMGPQHPSTHRVLSHPRDRGRDDRRARFGIGYLHTGIEKNLEYRTWTQGVTFVSRMDYLSPFFNETAYCLGVEKLLGVTDDMPERASVIRVMLMELNRISLTPGGAGHRRYGTGRDVRHVLRLPGARTDPAVFEPITGLRMNHAYVRPGGLAVDLPDDGVAAVRELLDLLPKRLHDMEDCSTRTTSGRRAPRTSATSI